VNLYDWVFYVSPLVSRFFAVLLHQCPPPPLCYGVWGWVVLQWCSGQCGLGVHASSTPNSNRFLMSCM